MALPSSGEIKASQINTEAGRSSSAEAPLSGSSSTPQAGSLVKIYEDAGVNQAAPHSYSEFYGIAFSRELTDCFWGEGDEGSLYYDGSIGDADNLSIGDLIYQDAALSILLNQITAVSQEGTSATTTVCSGDGKYLYMPVNSSGAITSISCTFP
tara:strand:+ start:1268 stop:1729 length:462 start_codon:yes stop_codon:yes gene_type:complete